MTAGNAAGSRFYYIIYNDIPKTASLSQTSITTGHFLIIKTLFRSMAFAVSELNIHHLNAANQINWFFIILNFIVFRAQYDKRKNRNIYRITLSSVCLSIYLSKTFFSRTRGCIKLKFISNNQVYNPFELWKWNL